METEITHRMWAFQPCCTSTKAKVSPVKNHRVDGFCQIARSKAACLPGAPSKSSAHAHPEHFTRAVSGRKLRVYGFIAGAHRNGTLSALCSSICLSIVMAVTTRRFRPVESAP